MREGIPSNTSFFVSFARGLGVDDCVVDEMASRWLPEWMARLADAPNRLGRTATWYRRTIRWTTFGLVDHIVLRTAAIDAQLSEAVRSGIDQVVILGAGLDARAWRMPVLVGSTVYEVDHPSTQQFKRRRIREATPPTDVRYVSVDFARERFSEALAEASFDIERPTAWVWEGVTMYLSVETVEDSLDQITALSATESKLIMTYRVPNALPLGRLGAVAIPLVFAMGGESLDAVFRPSDLHARLGPAWGVAYDEDAHDWRRFTTAPADPARSFLGERLAVATRED